MTKATLNKFADTEGFIFDADTHSYFFDGKPMTGCTTILGVMAKPALIQWAANQAVEYTRREVEACLTETGAAPELSVLDGILERARTAHAKFRDKRGVEGTDLHAIVEGYIKRCIAAGGKAQELQPDEADIEKFHLWAVEQDLEFIESEVKLYSKKLFVAGTADFMFKKGDKLFVGDIKNKKKIYGREPFFQCAGYSIMRSEMTGEAFDGYCVVRLWEDEIETLWSYDTEGDMEGFLACAKLYRLLKEDNIVK